MPHDATGNELKVGDKVVVEFTVQQVHQGTEGCNINIQMLPTDEFKQTSENYLPNITCNSKLLFKTSI